VRLADKIPAVTREESAEAVIERHRQVTAFIFKRYQAPLVTGQKTFHRFPSSVEPEFERTTFGHFRHGGYWLMRWHGLRSGSGMPHASETVRPFLG
jgi:hypothetical protein